MCSGARISGRLSERGPLSEGCLTALCAAPIPQLNVWHIAGAHQGWLSRIVAF